VTLLLLPALLPCRIDAVTTSIEAPASLFSQEFISQNSVTSVDAERLPTCGTQLAAGGVCPVGYQFVTTAADSLLSNTTQDAFVPSCCVSVAGLLHAIGVMD
jgi:hypothetical protein